MNTINRVSVKFAIIDVLTEEFGSHDEIRIVNKVLGTEEIVDYGNIADKILKHMEEIIDGKRSK